MQPRSPANALTPLQLDIMRRVLDADHSIPIPADLARNLVATVEHCESALRGWEEARACEHSDVQERMAA